MSARLSRSFVLAALALLTGCASSRWETGGTLVTAESGMIRFMVPEGWSYRGGEREPFFATRDGIAFQHLRLETREFLDATSLTDIAATLVEGLRADSRLTDFSLCETTATRVGGRAGFKLVYTFRSPDGVKRLEARYGCLEGPRLVQLCYQAPARHYFQRDLLAVEATVASLRILGALPAGEAR